MSNYTIPDEVRNIILECTVTDNSVILPNKQLDRPLYEAVNKALTNMGGKWKRDKGHLFTSDPRPKIAALLDTGVAIDEKKQFQAFYTPPELAALVVELACIEAGDYVLEPSAGEGALAAQMAFTRAAGLTCVEINPEAYAKLVERVKTIEGVATYNEDFMRIGLRPGEFDRVVMNPPFSGNQDIKHVERALSLLRRGGILVAIMSPNTSRSAFQELVRSHEFEVIPVPEGTFKESGTTIATIVVKITKA